jgi:glycosyltransferase involved in cell wall biosynthesis
VLRFFHDHRLFCLREHKYTAIGQRTCTQKSGWHCYSCLGFLNRSDKWPGVRLSSLGALRRAQEAQRSLDGFVVGSRYMARHLAAHGLAGDRTHVIPLFVEPATVVPAVPRASDTLLFVGQLVRGKGLDRLLRALPRLSHPARLDVVGDGRQRDELQRLAHQLGVADRVQFHGRVEPEELPRFYRRATALVVPSRAPETFALVGPEAMQHGTPVVATAVGGTGEWLEDGVTGLAVAADVSPGDLAGTIDRLLAHPDVARALGRQGQAVCAERFTPDRHVDALLGLMRRTAKKEVTA